MLELEVAVLDRDGKPVENLTREDFEVSLANKRVNVTNFYAVRRGAVVDEAERSQAKDEVKVETTIPTSLLILIDDTRLGQHAKKRALDGLREFVKSNIGPDTTALLARWNGGNLDVLTRPTEKPGLLLAEIDRLAGVAVQFRDSERRRLMQEIDNVATTPAEKEPVPNPDQLRNELMAYAEREASEVERTIKALREAVQLASAFDGRRAVLYVSEGLPMSGAAELFDYWNKVTTVSNPAINPAVTALMREALHPLDSARADRSQRFRELAKEAQRANVLFHALDAGGLRANDLSGVDAPLSLARLDPMLFRGNAQDGIRFVAKETGGRFIANENDLGRALLVMSEQYMTYYSLGVSAPPSTRLTKVSVKVKNRPQLRVVTARYRRALTREEDLERSVRTHLYTRAAENPLGVTLGVGAPAKQGEKCSVPFSIRPRAGTIWFALLDERMQESAVRQSADPNIAIGVRPGKYVLSVAVVAESGETSYLQQDIECR
ncbi:MAG TPA: VWA domain-containing protein [Thermoanaerobaculia bacterium]|nr:VWA domain-containing protein [Thermoanaerobaculia bacterium]